jgi:hypothetical protein
MLMGEGISAYQAGSIWYLFDATVGLPLTKVNKQQLETITLHPYSHIILPSGNYKSLTAKTNEKISSWVKTGGQLISLQKAANWVEATLQKQSKEEDKDNNENDNKSLPNKPYANFEEDNAQNTIGGAIISAQADLSHPLGFGMLHTKQYALLKGNSFLKPASNPYSTPLIADKKALAAGYISENKLKTVNGTSLVIAERLGKGTLIKFGFNPTFRGFWLGTQKWLINAVYFSSLIKKTKL